MSQHGERKINEDQYNRAIPQKHKRENINYQIQANNDYI